MSEARGRPFARGNQFGRGRPRGSRNKSTLALQELLGTHAEALVSKCVVSALQGDNTAMRLCMERLLPPLKNNLVQLPLPAVLNAVGVGKAMEQLVASVAQGQITPDDAEKLAKVLEARAGRLGAEETERQRDDILGTFPLLPRRQSDAPPSRAKR
ncbi:MAG: hypothetical protein ACJ746_06805 [Bryobacteraceae bacterium]